MAAYIPITSPSEQVNFLSETLARQGPPGEGNKRKIIGRTLITLTPLANPISRAGFERLREIESLLTTNPLYQSGGLDALKSFDRKTYNEYNKFSKQFKSGLASKATPGFTVIQRSVARNTSQQTGVPSYFASA